MQFGKLIWAKSLVNIQSDLNKMIIACPPPLYPDVGEYFLVEWVFFYAVVYFWGMGELFFFGGCFFWVSVYDSS